MVILCSRLRIYSILLLSEELRHKDSTGKELLIRISDTYLHRILNLNELDDHS